MSGAGDGQAASDARLSDDPEALRVFANHDDPEVRRAVASNAHTPDDLLHVLTWDEDIDVRIAAAGNPSTPLGPLRLMVNDRESKVVLAASRALDQRVGHGEEAESPRDVSPDVDQGATGEPSPPSTDPGEGKPAGWYPDPSGVHKHLAYWDGEQWTGETANPSGPRQKKANVGRIILFVALGFIGLIVLSLIVVSLGGEELSETFAEIEESLDDGGSSQVDSSLTNAEAEYVKSLRLWSAEQAEETPIDYISDEGVAEIGRVMCEGVDTIIEDLGVVDLGDVHILAVHDVFVTRMAEEGYTTELATATFVTAIVTLCPQYRPAAEEAFANNPEAAALLANP